jgi:hypothetical protein
MAIVKNNYVKPNGHEKAKAKATIRYIQNRPGQDNTKTSRTLFSSDGPIARHEAYRMIDEAEQGSVVFRFVISPDGKTEDTNRDLRLRDVTERTMLSFEDHIKQQVQWVGAVHADHTPLRHVHIVAVVPARMQREEFQSLPKVLRLAATNACIEQRQERDLTLAQHTQEREEASWERSH